MDGINLAQLPALTVVKPVDYETIVADIAARAGIENTTASDPAYRIALAAAYRETLLRQDANEQARGLMLAFAVGSQLDHLGATYYRDADGLTVVRLSGETDDDYRARLQLSPEGLSVAGPDGAYVFNAKSADPDVKDASVASPAPVEVVVTVLSHSSDGVATAALCAVVGDYLESRRPLTDRVTVQPAEVRRFSIDATLTMKRGPDPEVARQAAVDAAVTYVRQRHMLGGWVTRSGIDAAMTVEGVENVELSGFADVQCGPAQAPYCESITARVGGYV